MAYFGGERGIRTLEGLLTFTPLARMCFAPLMYIPILEIPAFIGLFSTRVHGYLQYTFHMVSYGGGGEPWIFHASACAMG